MAEMISEGERKGGSSLYLFLFGRATWRGAFIFSSNVLVNIFFKYFYFLLPISIFNMKNERGENESKVPKKILFFFLLMSGIFFLFIHFYFHRFPLANKEFKKNY